MRFINRVRGEGQTQPAKVMPGQKETKQLLENACSAFDVVYKVVSLGAKFGDISPNNCLPDIMAFCEAKGKMNALMSMVGDFPPETLLDQIDITMNSIKEPFKRLITDEFWEEYKNTPLEQDAQKARLEANIHNSAPTNESSVEIIKELSKRAKTLQNSLSLIAQIPDTQLPG